MHPWQLPGGISATLPTNSLCPASQDNEDGMCLILAPSQTFYRKEQLGLTQSRQQEFWKGPTGLFYKSH